MSRWIMVILAAAVLLSGTTTANSGVAPNEVCIYEHIDYVGEGVCFRVEPGMRHKLVPALGNMNDRASSILVGKEVYVEIYEHAHFAGHHARYVDNVRTLPSPGWQFNFDELNDLVSSLIVVPRHQSLSGVYLLEGFDTFRKREVFYPLPERRLDYSARYPRLDWMSMNDVATKVWLEGDVVVDLYEHANFKGKWIRLPGAGPTKQDRFDLKPYQFDGTVSSLEVRAIR